MKLQMFGTVRRATVPADTGRHGGRPYDSIKSKFFSIRPAVFFVGGWADPPPAEQLTPLQPFTDPDFFIVIKAG